MRQKRSDRAINKNLKIGKTRNISTAHAGNSVKNPDNQGTGIFYESKCTWDQ